MAHARLQHPYRAAYAARQGGRASSLADEVYWFVQTEYSRVLSSARDFACEMQQFHLAGLVLVLLIDISLLQALLAELEPLNAAELESWVAENRARLTFSFMTWLADRCGSWLHL